MQTIIKFGNIASMGKGRSVVWHGTFIGIEISNLVPFVIHIKKLTWLGDMQDQNDINQ